MDLNSIPPEFQNKIRLGIIASLISGKKTFNELKSITQATDGNLSVQLKHLEKSKYIKCTKAFYNNKPLSTFKITEDGKLSFIGYVSLLEKYL
jgi:DNA-binding HxlR family transcriptional regulator